MYDIADEESEIGKNRVAKVFKICKKYLNHHQKSVFRGEISSADFMILKKELESVIDKNIDKITFVKIKSKNVFEVENLGIEDDDLFI
jgi:CRISPR-associated protein Cas2